MATDDDTAAKALGTVKERASSAPRPTPSAVLIEPGSICGRIRANPLKHLAHLLHEKLKVAHGGPCNLLQVATEIHSEAKDKHNTTLRRIYDVVNVCEGAGVLARTSQRVLEPKRAAGSDKDVPPRCCPFRRTGKRSLKGGAEIQWLGGSSFNILGENDRTPHSFSKNQKLLHETEKREIVNRILQKRRICDTLSNQVAILQKLLDQNQAQCHLNHQYATESVNHSQLQLPANDSEVASMNSEVELRNITPVPDIYADLASLQSLEDFCNMENSDCDYLVDQQRPCTAKRLHFPFVMLAINPDANVDIFLSGNPSREVLLQLDGNYCMMDHIQIIKMLPEGRIAQSVKPVRIAFLGAACAGLPKCRTTMRYTIRLYMHDCHDENQGC